MSLNYEDSLNSFYHDYFDDNDYYYCISITLVVNLTSFVPDNQTNFQSNFDRSIDKVKNKIFEKSISSLWVKYEIPSSIKLKNVQTTKLASQPLPRTVAFYPDFF